MAFTKSGPRWGGGPRWALPLPSAHVQETAGGGDLNLQLFELPSEIEQLPSTDREAIGTF